MNNQELQNQIEVLTKQVEELKRVSIQVQMDPTTSLYLQPAVAQAALTLPTQTYSLVAPTGTAPTGSIWFYDTGVLATREIYMYSGSAWVKFK